MSFAERAAICEHNGGLTTSHAELLAGTCCAPFAPGESREQREATVIHLAAYLDKMRAAAPEASGP